MSDKPLTDEDFYDDDYVVHYDDSGLSTYYRSMASLPGEYFLGVMANCPGATGGSSMCIHPQYGFGWAIQDFQDEKKGLPLSLTVDPYKSEPDIRMGIPPTQLTGTITIDDLHVGEKYAVYRWDSTDTAFDYSNPVSIHRFTASKTTETYTDSQTFASNGATYYRCILDSAIVV